MNISSIDRQNFKAKLVVKPNVAKSLGLPSKKLNNVIKIFSDITKDENGYMFLSDSYSKAISHAPKDGYGSFDNLYAVPIESVETVITRTRPDGKVGYIIPEIGFNGIKSMFENLPEEEIAKKMKAIFSYLKMECHYWYVRFGDFLLNPKEYIDDVNKMVLDNSELKCLGDRYNKLRVPESLKGILVPKKEQSLVNVNVKKAKSKKCEKNELEELNASNKTVVKERELPIEVKNSKVEPEVKTEVPQKESLLSLFKRYLLEKNKLLKK